LIDHRRAPRCRPDDDGRGHCGAPFPSFGVASKHRKREESECQKRDGRVLKQADQQRDAHDDQRGAIRMSQPSVSGNCAHDTNQHDCRVHARFASEHQLKRRDRHETDSAQSDDAPPVHPHREDEERGDRAEH
jgi:hypothetical protein